MPVAQQQAYGEGPAKSFGVGCRLWCGQLVLEDHGGIHHQTHVIVNGMHDELRRSQRGSRQSDHEGVREFRVLVLLLVRHVLDAC